MSTPPAAALGARRTRRGPSALGHRPFRRLTLAWVSTNIGDSALYLVLAVWVRELTGSNAAAGLVFAALGLPALLAPVAGQLADRFSRRTLMIATNISIGLIVLALLTVTDSSGVWLIYAVTFCYGLAAYLTSASQSGLLRDMLSDEELPGANGLFTTIDQGLRLVSPLLGTGLYVLAGAHAVVVLTAICFGATALILTSVRLTESPRDTEPETRWRGITAGFSTLWSDPTLRLITCALAVAFGAAGFLNVLVFPLLEDGLGVDAAAIGLVVTVQGVGALAGGVSSAAVLKALGERRLVAFGIALLGGAMLVIQAVVHLSPAGNPLGLILACLGMAIGGVGIPWMVVGAANYRIRVTPANRQGRASAAMNMSLNAPQTAATIIAAGLVTVVDFRILLLSCALVLIGAAASCRPWAVDTPSPAAR